MADGFRWSCCDKDGNDEGCKSIKHKAKINLIMGQFPVDGSKKRKRESADIP